MEVSAQQPLLLGGLTDVAMALALASRAACSRTGSVSLTSAAAAQHHGGGSRLWRLSRGLRRGWRRRKKTHKNPQMGGNLAWQEEEQQGGLGRRRGTSSKGALSVLSTRPPGGHRVGQAPGAACPRSWRHPRSARSGSLPRPRQARRELRRSRPVQATHDSPEGWEKLPGRLGWTSKFRNHSAPPEV